MNKAEAMRVIDDAVLGIADSIMQDKFLNMEKIVEKMKIFLTASLVDYRQIIGSIKHWIKYFKGRKTGDYKY